MDLRRAILDASLDLIAAKGIEALSLREVARRLKVTHGAPYYHFRDRAAILAALTEEGLGLLTAELQAAVAGAKGGALGSFEACGRAYVSFAVTRSAYFKIIYRPELAGDKHHQAIEKASACGFQVLLHTVQRCQAEGMCRGVDAYALAMTGWATAHGLASLCVDGYLADGTDAAELGQTVATTLGALIAGA